MLVLAWGKIGFSKTSQFWPNWPVKFSKWHNTTYMLFFWVTEAYIKTMKTLLKQFKTKLLRFSTIQQIMKNYCVAQCQSEVWNVSSIIIYLHHSCKLNELLSFKSVANWVKMFQMGKKYYILGHYTLDVLHSFNYIKSLNSNH